MKRRQFLAALAPVAGLALPVPGVLRIPTRRRPDPRLVERWSWAMGQPVHLQLYHESEAGGLAAAQAALQELRRVEAHLSRFDDRSDLSELNRRAGRGPWRADTDLLAVLALAARYRECTGGAFNVTVEPLMRVWGFRELRKVAPGPRELAEARQAVMEGVIRIEGERIELPARHTALDLGGIGVGYGLDRAAVVLARHGVCAAMLDVSGDMLAFGAPPGERGWAVAIASPDGGAPPIAGTVLRNEAIATSANTRSVVVLGAAVAGHVMDPSDGRPARALRQATVTARSAVAADALSTAMLVSGRAAPGVRQSWMVDRVD